MDEDFDYASRVIAHRCPETVSFIVSFEVLQLVVEAIDALEERVENLALRAPIRPVDGHDAPGQGDEPAAA